MRFIPIFIIAFLFFNCNKDKFTTKPQLKYKSANTTTISGSQTLTLKLDLTDKEGDFSSFLGLKKTVSGCPGSNFIDSSTYVIPDDFISTKKTEGEISISLDRLKRGSNTCFLPGGGIKPDTTIFKFWTRDKAGNVSDTALSEKIIILN